MSISKLTLQNALALLTLPLYLVARPLLRLLQIARPGRAPTWVIGGQQRPALRPQRRRAARAAARGLLASSERERANGLALASDARPGEWLATNDYTLNIVGHVDSGANDAPSGARVRFGLAQELTEVLIAAELLISDYSGLICDYLALNRAIVFFPFDKSEYLAKRTLHVDYDDFAFGTLIISGEFREVARYESKRRRWEHALFPTLEPVYTTRTEQTISALEARRAP